MPLSEAIGWGRTRLRDGGGRFSRLPSSGIVRLRGSESRHPFQPPPSPRCRREVDELPSERTSLASLQIASVCRTDGRRSVEKGNALRRIIRMPPLTSSFLTVSCGENSAWCPRSSGAPELRRLNRWRSGYAPLGCTRSRVLQRRRSRNMMHEPQPSVAIAARLA